jgi:glycosyltransferase involved in cell wall biosynthesis
MKIFFDSQIFKYQNYGGISLYFANLIKQFLMHPDLGVEPVIQVYNYKNFNFNLISPELNKMVSLGKLRPDGKLFNLASLSREKIHFDLVHFTYYLPKLLLFNKNFPSISTIHDFIPELLFPIYSIKRRMHYFKRTYLRNSNGLIFVSNNALDSFHHLYPQLIRGYSKVIHHGVEVPSIQLHKKLNAAKEYFLYVGNRSSYKGFSLVLQALSNIARKYNVGLVCFGGGPQLRRERQVIKELGLTDRVEFFSDKDITLGELYHSAKALVNSSLLEGFGLTNLESLSFGCPVICSDINIFKEVLGDNAIFFTPNSSESLSSKMEQVLSPRFKLDLDIMQSHVKKYSWLKTATQTSDFYRYIVDRFNS